MRTIKRYSLPINKGKWKQLCEIARLYRSEKNLHLHYYNLDHNYIFDRSNLDQQMRLVKEKFTSPNGLQARQWKIVQKDAYQTVDKNWCALAAEIRAMISNRRNEWTEAEMHYGYWLVFSGKRLAELMNANAPVPEHFKVGYTEKKRVRNYIRRVVRRKRGFRPSARLAKSFALDTDMYRLVEKVKDSGKTSQFIKIMGLVPRKQIVVPLTGTTNICGTIKIILDFQRHRIEIHTTNSMTPPKNQSDGVVALDAGISEVFTDELGNEYEPTFGKSLTAISNQLNATGKARNKAYGLRKTSSKHKARRIFKYNLGKAKLRERKRKAKIRIEQQISHAIRQVVKKRNPSVIVTERLDIRGKAKSKGMSRLVSYWMRGSLKERLEFLALVEGFHHKQVNPAYSSQMCPTCLFVHKDNRKGDMFKCLNCGHTDHADRVAAINLCARYDDPDITIYTPKSVVLSILQIRFTASLQRQSESAIVAAPSVSGRTALDSLPKQSETPSLNSYNEYGTEMSSAYIR